ncbi:ANTAR domain-containing protein [Streptomyces sp. NPDC057757]|uniref:ANTAR domain-containing protein n=1 Tax=Streptomyces sp. NPDC057757 TaxID=3346241 RepID=UPI0036C308B8
MDWHGPQGADPQNPTPLRGIRREGVGGEFAHAVGSHVTVEQAVGVLLAVHGISPDAGSEVLREVSQRTDIKLDSVAEAVVAWAVGQQLPEPVEQELNAAVQRHTRGDATDQPR